MARKYETVTKHVLATWVCIGLRKILRPYRKSLLAFLYNLHDITTIELKSWKFTSFDINIYKS
jgi:hypothetical protein